MKEVHNSNIVFRAWDNYAEGVVRPHRIYEKMLKIYQWLAHPYYCNIIYFLVAAVLRMPCVVMDNSQRVTMVLDTPKAF